MLLLGTLLVSTVGAAARASGTVGAAARRSVRRLVVDGTGLLRKKQKNGLMLCVTICYVVIDFVVHKYKNVVFEISL